MTDATFDWDETAITIVPGFPSDLSSPSNGGHVYPASTLPFVKILRSEGYTVQLAKPEDLREVSHHASDVWLPVANFGLQVLAGGAGNVLSGILLHYFGATSRRRTVAHIRWNVQSRDGSVHQFEFDGDSDSAVEVARTFERSLGYGGDDD